MLCLITMYFISVNWYMPSMLRLSDSECLEKVNRHAEPMYYFFISYSAAYTSEHRGGARLVLRRVPPIVPHPAPSSSISSYSGAEVSSEDEQGKHKQNGVTYLLTSNI